MAKSISYAISNNGLFLQGIEPNENYTKTGTAPTMGARHSLCEYKTIWGKEKMFFEPLTFTSYIKILFEEFRWETKDFKQYNELKITTK